MLAENSTSTYTQVMSEAQNQFEEGLHELRMAAFDFARAEQVGTLVHGDPAKRMEWEFLGSHGVLHEGDADRLAHFEDKVRDLVAPIVGKQATARTTNVVRLRQGGFVEDEEEYSPVLIEGAIGDIEGVTAVYTTSYHIGFGDHVPGRYPKKGQFERYRICMALDDALVPLRDIDGTRHKIVLN